MQLRSVMMCVLVMLVGCPARRPVVVEPPNRPPTDAMQDGRLVPEVDIREARLRPRKHHAPLPMAASDASNAVAGNGEDCTVFCATMFGPGIGVTCHPWLDLAGKCHGMCYYENGYVVDNQTGQSHWRTGSGDLRPNAGDVPPFGYCSENGCTQDTFVECPWKGRGPTPPMIGEFCLAMARSEYHEGYNFCGQAQ